MSKAALSSSSIKMLSTSPKKYKFVTDYGSAESQPLRDGWLFHTAILEPDVFNDQIFVDVQSKNTKKYKEALAEHGKVFTQKEKRDAERLADAFLRNEQALRLLDNSELSSAPCAPGTLETLAKFVSLSRLQEPENSSIYSKMRVYDGESLKDTDPKAKSYQEYRDYAGVDEGMTGLSTRFAFKILSRVFNFDHAEVAANPVHLFYVLEQQIEREQFNAEVQERYLSHLKGYLIPQYVEFIGKELQTAYLESYSEYGQNIFDRYVTYADFWIQDQEYRDPDTGQLFDRAALNAELEKIEKPAGISNPKDFRNEIVNFVLRARAHHNGENPVWTSYEKLRTVIEKKMFSNTEDLLPVISFNAKTSAEDQKKHEDFVNRMVEKGYTEKQVRLLSEWYLRVRKSQ